MSSKSKDKLGRWRSKTVAFRVSPEEAREIDALVALSGLTKQEYILNRLLDREITVVPSSRIHKALREQVARMYRELRRVADGTELSPEMQEVLAVMAKEYSDMGKDAVLSDTKLEERALYDIERG